MPDSGFGDSAVAQPAAAWPVPPGLTAVLDPISDGQPGGPGRRRGDSDLNPHLVGTGAFPDAATARALCPAAVLVGIQLCRDELAVLLIQRAGHGADPHSGQVAFPGGKIDAGDAGPVAAALREAEEEVGLTAGHAQVLGALTPYVVRSGFLVSPVVAALSPGFGPVPRVGEVAAAFHLPLAHVLAPGAFRRETTVRRGAHVAYYILRHRGYNIWGATAHMLVDLAERLGGRPAAT